MAGSFSDGGGTPEGAPSVARGASRRAAEMWTAAGAGLIGVVVAAESLTHDVGWNEAGPGPGYFPFRIGLLVIAAAILRLLQIRLGPRAATIFVTREELARSLSVFVPTVALVVAMFPLGCYVPSAAYLAWMMRRHGGRGWLPSAAYGIAVMAAFFLIFDVWFRVPLAKGPVEAALGLY